MLINDVCLKNIKRIGNTRKITFSQPTLVGKKQSLLASIEFKKQATSTVIKNITEV